MSCFDFRTDMTANLVKRVTRETGEEFNVFFPNRSPPLKCFMHAKMTKSYIAIAQMEHKNYFLLPKSRLTLNNNLIGFNKSLSYHDHVSRRFHDV